MKGLLPLAALLVSAAVNSISISGADQPPLTVFFQDKEVGTGYETSANKIKIVSYGNSLWRRTVHNNNLDELVICNPLDTSVKSFSGLSTLILKDYIPNFRQPQDVTVYGQEREQMTYAKKTVLPGGKKITVPTSYYDNSIRFPEELEKHYFYAKNTRSGEIWRIVDAIDRDQYTTTTLVLERATGLGDDIKIYKMAWLGDGVATASKEVEFTPNDNYQWTDIELDHTNTYLKHVPIYVTLKNWKPGETEKQIRITEFKRARSFTLDDRGSNALTRGSSIVAAKDGLIVATGEAIDDTTVAVTKLNVDPPSLDVDGWSVCVDLGKSVTSLSQFDFVLTVERAIPQTDKLSDVTIYVGRNEYEWNLYKGEGLRTLKSRNAFGLGQEEHEMNPDKDLIIVGTALGTQLLVTGIKDSGDNVAELTVDQDIPDETAEFKVTIDGDVLPGIGALSGDYAVIFRATTGKWATVTTHTFPSFVNHLTDAAGTLIDVDRVERVGNDVICHLSREYQHYTLHFSRPISDVGTPVKQSDREVEVKTTYDSKWGRISHLELANRPLYVRTSSGKVIPVVKVQASATLTLSG